MCALCDCVSTMRRCGRMDVLYGKHEWLWALRPVGTEASAAMAVAPGPSSITFVDIRDMLR